MSANTPGGITIVPGLKGKMLPDTGRRYETVRHSMMQQQAAQTIQSPADCACTL